MGDDPGTDGTDSTDRTDSSGGTETGRPGSLALRAVDGALAAQEPLVRKHLQWLRRNRPDAPPAEILRRLTREYRLMTLGTGAGAGAVAARPGGGVGRSVAVTGTEAATFLHATALYVLTMAEIHGVQPTDLDRRRTLVLSILLGHTGSGSVRKIAGRTGAHWARSLVEAVPASQIKAINKVLGRHFVTRYSTTKGVLVLGQIVPVGVGAAIGGAVNLASAQAVISAAHTAFGSPPATWVDEPEIIIDIVTD